MALHVCVVGSEQKGDSKNMGKERGIQDLSALRAAQGDCQQEINSGGKRACTLSFKEDGIEIFPTSQNVYLADLDLKVVPGKRDHSGLLLIRGGDVWLKNVTFSGAGEDCRAIDITGNARLFMTGVSLPS
jgi:hypothetical protein